MRPDRQQGSAPAVLQLQDAAIQALPMLEPASQCLTQQALEVVLQHHRSAAHQQNLCTLLQVSKAWKAALLQAAAGQIDISIHIEHVDQLSRITTLAPWLRKYGACVGSLAVTCYLGWTSDPSEVNSRLELQLKAVSQIVASLERGVLDHNTSSLVPWSSLRTLTIDLPVDGGLLAVLPTSLTRMTITTKASSTDFAALRMLQNLRHLGLNSQSELPQSCLRELCSLTVLTFLFIQNPARNVDWRQVPGSLENLFVMDSIRPPAGAMQINLVHISGLTKICLTCDGLLNGSQVPVSVRDLVFLPFHGVPADMILVPLGVSELTALTKIRLDSMIGACQALGLLVPLTQLQVVDISWTGEPHELINMASSLCNVPGELKLHAAIHSSAGVASTDSEHMMQQLGALTRLTDLQFLSVLGAQGVLGAEPPVICKHLSSLASLQNLEIMAQRPFVKQDVQYLTALRSLTYLYLYPSRPEADYLSLPLPFN